MSEGEKGIDHAILLSMKPKEECLSPKSRNSGLVSADSNAHSGSSGKLQKKKEMMSRGELLSSSDYLR